MPKPGGRVSVERAVLALVDRYGLEPEMGDQLGSLVAVLVADPLAPTTVTDPARAVDDHLADSLVALELPEVRSATAIADLGAGAGFPGLPLAIALPGAAVALVESSTRKCEFIERAATAGVSTTPRSSTPAPRTGPPASGGSTWSPPGRWRRWTWSPSTRRHS